MKRTPKAEESGKSTLQEQQLAEQKKEITLLQGRLRELQAELNMTQGLLYQLRDSFSVRITRRLRFLIWYFGKHLSPYFPLDSFQQRAVNFLYMFLFHRETFWALRKGLHGVCEMPRDEKGAVYYGEISGWAYAPEGIRAIEIHINGQYLGNASYGAERNDVYRTATPLIETSKVGFHFLLDRSDVEEEHSLKIRIISNQGKEITISRSAPCRRREEKTLHEVYVDHFQQQESPEVISWVERVQGKLRVHPLFGLCIFHDAEGEELDKTVESAQIQVYKPARISLTGGKSPKEELKEVLKETDYICMIRAGDILSPHALYEFAVALQSPKNPDIIYADSKWVNSTKTETRLNFKPDWSPELLQKTNYIGTTFLVKKAALLQVLAKGDIQGNTPFHELLCQITKQEGVTVRHLREILSTEKTEAFQSPAPGEELAGEENPQRHSALLRHPHPLSPRKPPILLERCEPYFTTHEGRELDNASDIDPSRIKKILIIKLDHIGDVVLSIPAMKLLKRKFPEAEITALIGSWAKSVIEHVPEVDKTVLFNYYQEKSEKGKTEISPERKKEIMHTLNSRSFDLVVDLRRNAGNGEVFNWVNAPYKVSYQTTENREFLTNGLKAVYSTKDIPGQPYKEHVTIQLLRLIHALPSKTTVAEDFFPELPIFRFKQEEEVLQKYRKYLEGDLVVGIHPASGSSIRQWSTGHYAELADTLIEKRGAKILFFGVEREKGVIDEVCSKMRNSRQAESLLGMLSLTEYMIMTGRLDLFVGNLSAPCHIAAILGTPTLSIVGGQVSPFEWQPLGDLSLSLRAGLNCAPCYKAYPAQCPHAMKCLTEIRPEDAFVAVDKLLRIAGKI